MNGAIAGIPRKVTANIIIIRILCMNNCYINLYANEDGNIQCKNITKRRARAKTGRRTERKQHEMGHDGVFEKSDEKRKVSSLSKVATCCITLRPTTYTQV